MIIYYWIYSECFNMMKNCVWFQIKKNEVKCKFLLKRKHFTPNVNPRLL